MVCYCRVISLIFGSEALGNHAQKTDVCSQGFYIIRQGKIVEIKDKTFVIEYLTTKAVWSGRMDFKVNEIRTVAFDNDYINSLKLVARKPGSKGK